MIGNENINIYLYNHGKIMMLTWREKFKSKSKRQRGFTVKLTQQQKL